MEFGILGPLQVLDGGQAVALPRRMHRALLAVLLLRAGKVVSADRLIEELWGETPPRTAKDALEAYQAARLVLDEQLGLEPGPPLRELEQAILKHDPALGTSRPAATPASRRTVTVLVAGLPGAVELDPETLAEQFAELRRVV